MNRQHLEFSCEGATLVGTLDRAEAAAGLLLITGGNETRAGAFSGQAQMAASVAAAGYPVFRFDRRGTGDSEGSNSGFKGSAADIIAAIAAFRSEIPQLSRIVGFGNCDAASALMLTAGSGCDALVLANPWTIESDDAAPPPAALRARYAEKLRNPREIIRLLKGQVSIPKLLGGVRKAMRLSAQKSSLANEMADKLKTFSGKIHILLASRDRTAQAFEAAWPKGDQRIVCCKDASHAFGEPHARQWLLDQLLAALAQEQAGQLNMA